MSTPRRKVRDEEEARHLLAQMMESGLELREFCKHEGIDGRSLHCWSRNLEARDPKPLTPLRLVEVVGHEPVRQAEYRVVLGDLVVEVDDNFREETLLRLLRAVTSC